MAERQNARLYTAATEFIYNRLQLLETIKTQADREIILREVEVLSRAAQAAK